MKNVIRNWLGISEIERTVREIEVSSATEKETKLRKMVGEAIGAALEGETDSEWWPYMYHVVEKNTLQRALEKASVETASNVAKMETANRIGGEAFIDEIVARIQRKQLGA